MEKNYSRGIPYHSQRNNQVVPFASCNTTSAIMALKQAHIPIIEFEDEQPEDSLSRILETEEAWRKMKQLAPWSYDKWGKPIYRPQEVHVCLEWGINLYVGESVDTFCSNLVLQDLVSNLDLGFGIVLSGVFPVESGELHHMVSLAGYVEEEGSLSHYIIDDPYGNWHTAYTDHRGNDVRLTRDQFVEIFDRHGKYWAHMIGA